MDEEASENPFENSIENIFSDRWIRDVVNDIGRRDAVDDFGSIYTSGEHEWSSDLQALETQNIVPKNETADVDEAFHEFSPPAELLLTEDLMEIICEDIQDEQKIKNHDTDLPSMEQIGVLAANIQVPSTVNQSSSCRHVPSSLPASQNWPGKYEFTASFNFQDKQSKEKIKKGVSCTYSKHKNKLFVKKDASCPINFSTNTVMSNEFTIRAMALYTSPKDASEVVHRCVNHSSQDLHKGCLEAEHLIRCESKMASYVVDFNTHRHSVVVPFENPAVGQQFSTYIFKFVCFGSCSGGPNRRPLMIVFTLEKNGQVFGRQKFDVKICACPGRDRNSEENLLETEGSSLKRRDISDNMNISNPCLEFAKNNAHPSSKKAKILPNKNGHYTITVDDLDKYEFLKQMGVWYDINKNIKKYNKALARCKEKKESRN